MSGSTPLRLANTARFLVSALASMVIGVPAAFAAPPANDTCVAPIALALNVTTAGTLLGATNDYELAPSSPCFTGLSQTFTTADGVDTLYSFTAPSAANYSFKIWNSFGGMNPVLYTAAACPAATPGTPVIVECNAASNRSTGSSEEIMCQPLAAGQQVFLFADRTATTGGGPFFLQAEACTAQESEANGTPATADLAACALESSLSPGGDVDFFAIGAPPLAWRIFAMVETAGAGNNDSELRITTATDTLEHDGENNDSSWGTFGSNVAGTPASGAPIFARVTGFSNITVIQPYRLYTTVQPPSAQAVAESEPNGSIASANAAAGNYFTGTLTAPAPATDQDHYSFQATAGDLLFLSLDGDPTRDNTPIDAQIALLDAAGAELISAADEGTQGATSNTTSGAGSLTASNPFSPAEAIIFRAPTTGTFYARVAIQTTSTATIGAGDYLLSISKNCGGSRFKTMAPCRAVDTRNPPGPLGGPVLNAGFPRVFNMVGACGIPASAKALALNVTVVNPTFGGSMAVYPGDLAIPITRVVSYAAATTRASIVVVGLAADGTLAVYPETPWLGSDVHVVIDVTGYFE